MNKTDGGERTIWDVVVVGGGPAGMMAAATAAASGASVLLLEKNNRLGKKLSITGGGRCNITNNKPVVRDMLASYKDEGKFLFSTFSQHGVVESLAWFLDRGMAVKEENEGRLFPASESAEDVCRLLETELQKQAVAVLSNQTALRISKNQVEQHFVIETETNVFQAKRCVLATGGYARPDTGSTGDGFLWLQSFGHTIHKNSGALVPVVLRTIWTKSLSGLTLPEVGVSVWVDGKKQFAKTGRVLFTHVGLSGPLILNMSKQIGDYLSEGSVELRFNLFPGVDAGVLKLQLTELLTSNKKLQNALAEVLPAQLVRGLLGELGIDGETPCHSVEREVRGLLLQAFQSMSLVVGGLLGEDKAIVSSGGVELTEIDFKTMSSKLIPGLHVVGDLLNINRPSGGYSLQLCWSTGYVAGLHAARG
ncbi:aminoacetone oxidase family FAD-binding enzyme [Candidatus Kaiserbacteria bacterium]|nr:aminoacetone oxidase family FAD-binding enzyme [Candidatus Kaiserbacteria bacterium]